MTRHRCGCSIASDGCEVCKPLSDDACDQDSQVRIEYREAQRRDIAAMARIRAEERGTQAFWETRIKGYLDCEHHPQRALMPRVIYAAFQGDSLVGFIAGHLTRRYACDGELQWINVAAEWRGSGVAGKLLHLLAAWFAERKAARVCVNVDPSNTVARRFYERHCARTLNEEWLVWNDIGVVLSE